MHKVGNYIEIINVEKEREYLHAGKIYKVLKVENCDPGDYCRVFCKSDLQSVGVCVGPEDLLLSSATCGCEIISYTGPEENTFCYTECKDYLLCKIIR